MAAPGKLRSRPAALRSRDRFAFFFGPDSNTLEERFAAEFGGRLAVIDIPHGGDIRRCLASLRADGLVLQQSIMSLMRPEKLIFPYEQAMSLAAAIVPQPRRGLLLGLGGGAMSRFLAAYFPDCALTIIESDSTIIDLARRHFRIEGEILQEDGIQFVSETKLRFDFILVDIYGSEGFNAPPLDFWDRCAAILEPRGSFAINWAEARDKPLYEPHAARAAAVAASSFYLAPAGFKDNVVQLCSMDESLDVPLLRQRAAALARRQRRRSILDRCAILSELP